MNYPTCFPQFITPQHSVIPQHQPVMLPPYPTRIFTGVLGEIFRCLVGIGLPAEIVGTELIAFVSLLTQGLADVMWPKGGRMPIGGNGLLIAPSGSGKSLVFHLLMEAIEQCLMDLKYSILLEDATRQAIVLHLKDWPVAGLFTEELGQLKSLLKDSPTLVKLMDGHPLYHSRSSEGRIELLNHRFTVLLLGQPSVFDMAKVLISASGGVGMMNRFFLASSNRLPSSYQNAGFSGSLKMTYTAKVSELLGKTVAMVESGCERPVVHLSKTASEFISYLQHETHQHCLPGGRWSHVSEYASRHPERVLKFSGAAHIFEQGIESEISINLVQQIATLGEHSIASFAHMTYVPPRLTKAQQDAGKLEHALRIHAYQTRQQSFKKNELRILTINIGLTAPCFEKALAILAERGVVQVFVQRGQAWLTLSR